MKILKHEIEEYKEIIKKIPFKSKTDDYMLFFPIDGDDMGIETSDMLILTEKEERGVNTFVKPGLLVCSEGMYESVQLAFVHTAYQYNMKMKEYFDIRFPKNVYLTKEEIDKICSKEALLVKKENIMARFDF